MKVLIGFNFNQKVDGKKGLKVNNSIQDVDSGEAKEMKKIGILLIALLVISVGFLSGCTDRTYCISAEKLDDGPSNYVNMSDQQLEDFPRLKEAMLTEDYVTISYEEWNELINFFDAELHRPYETDHRLETYVVYQNEYYLVVLEHSM